MMLGGVFGAMLAALVSRQIVRVLVARARHAERQARANERMAEIGAMTGGLTHEIKNPLSTIGLNAQLIAEGVGEIPLDQPCEPEAKARLQRRVDGLGREVDRLRDILSDFLSYAGEVRVSQVPIDVCQLLGEFADFYSPQAMRQRVQLRIDTPSEPLMASIDSKLIKQAVLNLVLNAVQAIGPEPVEGSTRPREVILRANQLVPKGLGASKLGALKGGRAGRVAVGLLDVDRAAVQSQLQKPEQDWIELHVIDTGPGIDQERAARIFQPYYTTKAGGSGLGLAITRRIIEAHGGRIELLSQPGQGSDFVLHLPAYERVDS